MWFFSPSNLFDYISAFVTSTVNWALTEAGITVLLLSLLAEFKLYGSGGKVKLVFGL
jgi:hypothetical protein